MTNNHLLLYRLAELMLEKQQHILPLDDLFEDEEIGAFVRSIQIDSPYQQLIFEGVLTETIKEERVMVTFTVEGYFHYILGEVIYNQAMVKEPKYLKNIIDNNHLKGTIEGVEQCLIRDVEDDDLSRLMWLIDKGGKALEASVYPLALAFTLIEGNPKTDKEKEEASKNQIEKVMDELLADSSDYDIEVLEKAIEKLVENGKYNIINNLIKSRYFGAFKNIIKLSFLKFLSIENLKLIYNEFNDPNLKLCLNYYFGNYEEAIKIYKNRNFDFINEAKFAIKGCLIDIGDFKTALSIDIKTNEINNQIEIYRLDSIANNGLENHIISNNLIEKGIKISKDFFGSYHNKTAELINLLGLYQISQSKFEISEQNINTASNIFSKIYGENSFDYAMSLNNLGLINYHSTDYNKSIKYWFDAIKILDKIGMEEHPETIIIYNNLATASKKVNDIEQALKCYSRALDFNLKTKGLNNKDTGKTFFSIAEIYMGKKNFKTALDYFKKGFLSNQDSGGFPFKIAICYENLNQSEEATKNYCLSAEIRKNALGIEDDSTQKAIQEAIRLAKETDNNKLLPDWIKMIADDQ